jgi:hypothetical protein
LLPPETLADMLKEIERGNIAGGGGVLNFGKVGLVERGFVGVCNAAIRAFKMTAGCFIFCRSDLFREAGGFDQEYFAGEDAEFGKALKRVARARGMRLAILTRHPPLTSDRKFRLYGLRKILLAVGRYAFLPKSTMRDKRYLDIFYDGKR